MTPNLTPNFLIVFHEDDGKHLILSSLIFEFLVGSSLSIS